MLWTDVYPASHFGGVLSTLIVASTSISLLVLAVVAFGRARQRTRLAIEEASMLEPDHELRAGGLREGEILLSGVVAHADDHDVAVRIDVMQDGTEAESSGSYSYRWTESHREVTVRPFYLVLPDKTRVRVLAPKNVEVADELDQKVLLSRTSRKLSAELIPGETLHARGRLERGAMLSPGGETGYRDAEYEWQLVPNKGRMLLSSEPLGVGMAQRARFHNSYGWWAVGIFLCCQVVFSNYYSRVVATAEHATVVGKSATPTTDSDGNTDIYYALLVQGETRTLEPGITGSEYERIGIGHTIAVKRGILTTEIGGFSSLNIGASLLTFGLAVTIILVYLLRRRSTRPWFRRKVIHKGAGQLPGPM